MSSSSGVSERYHRLAVGALERLLKASPKSDSYKDAMVPDLIFLGDAVRAKESSPEAETHYLRALTLQQDVMKNQKSPGSEQLRQLGIIYERLGLAATEGGRVTDAERAYAQAVSLFSDLVEREPSEENNYSLCLAHDNMGDVRRTQGLLAKSEQSYLASLALREKALNANPADPERKHAVSISLRRLASIERGRGATSEERALNERARTLLRQSLTADKNHEDWGGRTSRTRRKHGGPPGEEGHESQCTRALSQEDRRVE